MNSRKFNIYKNAIYFYIASAVLLTAGLVVGIVLGLKSDIAISGRAILNTTLAVMVFSLIAFIFLTVKFDGYTGFTGVLAIVHNVILTVALTCIFRTPVNENLGITILIVCIVSIMNMLLMFENKKEEYKSTTNRESLVNNLVSQKFKTVLVVNCILFFTTILMIFSLEANIINLVRTMLVGIVVCFYSAIFMVAPFWGRFVKEKKDRKSVKVDEDFIK